MCLGGRIKTILKAESVMEPTSPEEKFIFLISINQRKIYSFVLTAVGIKQIAEEIMQQTLLVMWRNFSRFEEGTNFAAWGKEIAKYEIFNYRKKKARDLLLDPEALNRVMEASMTVEQHSDERMKALEGCLKKLSERKRRFIQYRYHDGLSCIQIAEKFQSPVSSIYKTFARLHTVLQSCIHRTLLVWEAES